MILVSLGAEAGGWQQPPGVFSLRLALKPGVCRVENARVMTRDPRAADDQGQSSPSPDMQSTALTTGEEGGEAEDEYLEAFLESDREEEEDEANDTEVLGNELETDPGELALCRAESAKRTAPIEAGEHVVAQGECFTQIAFRAGFHPDTLWKHAANADLRKKRKNPHVLMAGDTVVVPEKQPGNASCGTEESHLFRRKGVPSRFTLILDEMGKPRANEAYRLIIDDSIVAEGVTDEDGSIAAAISPVAAHGLLLLGEDRERIPLDFGCVDPITEVSGVQTRLQNLGYYLGEVDGELTDETRDAITDFQRAEDLPPDGELTGQTRQILLKRHGG